MKIFNNNIPSAIERRAIRKRNRFARKFGFDENMRYPFTAEKNQILGNLLGIHNLVIGPWGEPLRTKKSVILGTIRMGYGHYRPAMAIASAAHSMGITPYWLDILSYEDSTGAKIVRHIEKLYSLGSRLSQKSALFNTLYWEPLMAEGMKKLATNVEFSYMCELMAPLFRDLPDEIPIVATHSWAALAALKAQKKRVINMIPDNWPLGLHLAEGALHCVQTPSAYMGYRTLKNMFKKGKALLPIPSREIAWVGHNIDHELVSNIEKDCAARITRMKTKKPRRFLISIGGAGAQLDLTCAIIEKLAPYIKKDAAMLFVNCGDHKNVFDAIEKKLRELSLPTSPYFDWDVVQKFSKKALTTDVNGVHLFYNPNIFVAVYTTNLLMRASDVLVTKPSELAFYPVPKLLIKRVGGHEAWGAIRSSEVGDGTVECETEDFIFQAIELLIEDDDLFLMFCENIIKQKKIGTYDGAYNVVTRAMKWYGNG
ncbi:MAG: hypothetical protein N2316_02870 [Spirochaetes bacterium]|nr:hypothetical protein [Spirochaetota bacterium]